jgi:hypothetical protein
MRVRNILGAALAALALTTTSAERQRLWADRCRADSVPMDDLDNDEVPAYFGFGAQVRAGGEELRPPVRYRERPVQHRQRGPA